MQMILLWRGESSCASLRDGRHYGTEAANTVTALEVAPTNVDVEFRLPCLRNFPQIVVA